MSAERVPQQMSGRNVLDAQEAQRRADALARAEARDRVRRYPPEVRRQLRVNKRWSLQTMADVVGGRVTRQAIGHWESTDPKHARTPRPEHAELYADVLDLLAMELAARTDEVLDLISAEPAGRTDSSADEVLRR